MGAGTKCHRFCGNVRSLGRNSEAAAWMREYVPRFEAASYMGPPGTRMVSTTSKLYYTWARTYFGKGTEGVDGHLWRN